MTPIHELLRGSKEITLETREGVFLLRAVSTDTFQVVDAVPKYSRTNNMEQYVGLNLVMDSSPMLWHKGTMRRLQRDLNKYGAAHA